MPRDVWFYRDQNGVEYTLNDNVIVFLQDVQGHDGAAVSSAGDRYPYQQGEEFREGSQYAGPIDVAFLMRLMHDTYGDAEAFADAYLRNLNPFKGQGQGRLRRRRPDGTDRALDCIRAAGTFKRDGPASGDVYLRFHGKYPFWYDPTQHEEIFGLMGDAGIAFPITFPITFGVADIDASADTVNDGDIPAWPTIKVLGPGTNPTVDNDTTGKVMAITQVLDTGDYITIDMKEAVVWFYDATDGSTTQINDSISAASEFWQLQPGVNSVHVTMADTTSGSVELWYTVYYLKA
jgi:hypothetical protein